MRKPASLGILFCFVMWVQVPEVRAAQPQAELRIEGPGRTHAFTIKELRSKLPLASLTVKDPVYKSSKTYEGFWLKDVLRLGGIGQDGGDELVFKCLDGYSPTLPWARIDGRQGLLAIREKGRKKGDWEPFLQGKAKITPAPLYLVWDTSDSAYPWPYQLIGIEVVRFQVKYSRVFPAGVDTSAPVYQGFDLFRAQCMRCHSINLQGGDLGPELNIPQNITEYREEVTLRQFIRSPEAFRAKSKMPSFQDLSDAQLDALIAYLRWAKDHKQKVDP